MIIGINGYIGSGKDTVGKIIQYLESSSSQSFEDYFASTKDGIHYNLPEAELFPSKWKIKKFAGKLKEIASMLTGIPKEKFEDQEFKKTHLGPEWNYSRRLPRESLEQENIYYEDKQMTVREFLQKLGTEAMRDGLHTNVWVNALFSDYKAVGVGHKEYRGHGDYYEEGEMVEPNWIITDCRFPNEAQAIKDKGGIIVRLERLSPESIDSSIQRHPSEVSLDDWEFDHVIENNGTIEELTSKVKDFMVKFDVHDTTRNTRV